MVASVETPVMIPLRYPLNAVVVPAPGITELAGSCAVTPYPTVKPAVFKLLVVIPITWSAWSSMKQTF